MNRQSILAFCHSSRAWALFGGVAALGIAFALGRAGHISVERAVEGNAAAFKRGEESALESLKAAREVGSRKGSDSIETRSPPTGGKVLENVSSPLAEQGREIMDGTETVGCVHYGEQRGHESALILFVTPAIVVP